MSVCSGSFIYTGTILGLIPFEFLGFTVVASLKDSIWSYLLQLSIVNYSELPLSDSKRGSQAAQVDALERNALASLLGFNSTEGHSTDDVDNGAAAFLSLFLYLDCMFCRKVLS